MFTVPKLSSTIAKRSLTRRTITNDPIQREGPKKADPFTLPNLTLGSRRAGLLARLLEKGRIRKSEYTFAQLQQKTHFPDLQHAEADCLDEADLRSKFPKQGVSHKFFSSGNFKYEFWLPSDSDSVVVAQILWNGKARLPMD